MSNGHVMHDRSPAASASRFGQSSLVHPLYRMAKHTYPVSHGPEVSWEPVIGVPHSSKLVSYNLGNLLVTMPRLSHAVA